MKVRKHKRVNKEKDEFYNKIKDLVPNSFVRKSQLSIFIKVCKGMIEKFGTDIIQIENAKLPVRNLIMIGTIKDFYNNNIIPQYEVKESPIEFDLGLDANDRPCIFANGKWILQ